jgi:hypothetical protein
MEEPINFSSIESAQAAWVFGGFSFICLACGSVHEAYTTNEKIEYIHHDLLKCDVLLSKYFLVCYVTRHPDLKIYLPKQDPFESLEPCVEDLRSHKLITWLSEIIQSQIPSNKLNFDAFKTEIYWLAMEPNALPDLYQLCLNRVNNRNMI